MLEIHDLDALDALLASGSALTDVIIQDIDLNGRVEALLQRDVRGLVLLGVDLEASAAGSLVQRGALVFPLLPSLPYRPYRVALYRPEELYAGFVPEQPGSYQNTLDARVYAHWKEQGAEHPRSSLEALSQRLHDHSLSEAKSELLAQRESVVAFMGGHSLLRSDPHYARVVEMARELTRLGYFLVSGGGPGAMEATNLGAFIAGIPDSELGGVLELLSQAPKYDDPRWLSTAFQVRERFRQTKPMESLGVPTWLYGHEPPNPFATHIAKLFQNSVREDALVSVATRGIIFAPGSAGTVQEIFQDAAQNHYGTNGGVASPMVFFGTEYWTKTLPVWPLIEALSEGRPYSKLLHVSDDVGEIVAWLHAHPPIVL